MTAAKTRRTRLAWGAVSAAAHVGLALGLLLAVAPPAAPVLEPETIPVALAPRPVPPPEPPAPEPKPEPPKPAPPTHAPTVRARKPLPAPPDVAPLRAVAAKADQPGDVVTDDEVASAARAGSGGGGGECDMARLLEDKLRRDGRVKAALSAVPPGRPIRLWNGDWVRHGEEEGAGLSALREAIQWEVAWAPAVCKQQPVRGLVLISVADARVVVGTGAWRWSDLLFSRSTRPASRSPSPGPRRSMPQVPDRVAVPPR